MSQPIVPVILCGGSGTRLWPLSRASYPKQFNRMLGEKSLFQASVERLPDPDFAPPIVVTNSEFRFIATEQLAQIGRAPGAVLIEPDGRNTAPAVLAAALKRPRPRRTRFLLVCPSDHVIADAAAFRTTVRAGMRAAIDGDLVTFGIVPERAETGYGWLALDTAPDMDAPPAPLKLAGFVEKPDAATAEAMQADGRHLWNSGIFLFSVKAILKAFETHAPELIAAVRARGRRAPSRTSGSCGSTPRAGPRCPRNLDRLRGDGTSRPISPWCRSPGAGPTSAAGMRSPAKSGATRTASPSPDRPMPSTATHTLLRSESPEQTLVGIGLKNIVAVAMPDAVLVADISDAQDVKRGGGAAEGRRREAGRRAFPRITGPGAGSRRSRSAPASRSSGSWCIPAAALSLQSHHHRAEHWVVVAGHRAGHRRRAGPAPEPRTSRSTSRSAPCTGWKTPARSTMDLIEVQTGPYLGEDDIIRYEDVYARK